MEKWKQQDLEDLIPTDLRECEQGYVHVFESLDPSSELWVKSVCSRPWCRQCEGVRVWRLQRKILKYLNHNYDSQRGFHLWVVTRSVRNTPEMVSSFNSLRSAQVAWTKQNVREENHPLREAVFWIETTEIKYSHEKGFNVHAHAIWGTQSSRLDFKIFHETWDRAAGFVGAHINIQRVTDSRHATNYIAKYLSKGFWGGLSSGRAYLCASALRGRNRIQTKRFTLPARAYSSYCYCCLPSTSSECWGEGTRRPESNDIAE